LYFFMGVLPKWRPLQENRHRRIPQIKNGPLLESPDSALSKLWDREHDEHVAASLMRRVQGDFAQATWQAFRRHVLEGEPAVQVAEALGLSLNSVLLAKSHVLKRLRQEAAGLVD
jgi:RNA polymerase sigma-70 factor (ECF subfamily)